MACHSSIFLASCFSLYCMQTYLELCMFSISLLIYRNRKTYLIHLHVIKQAESSTSINICLKSSVVYVSCDSEHGCNSRELGNPYQSYRLHISNLSPLCIPNSSQAFKLTSNRPKTLQFGGISLISLCWRNQQIASVGRVESNRSTGVLQLRFGAWHSLRTPVAKCTTVRYQPPAFQSHRIS